MALHFKQLIIPIVLSMSFFSNAQKAFDEYLLPKSFQPFGAYTNQALPTSTSDVTVTINSSNVVNQVRQSLFGQNAVGWQGNLNTSAKREENWKNAAYSMLRYPGGNWSNLFFWDGNTPSSIQYESTLKGDVANLQKGNAAWMLETDEFPDLLNFMNADGIVCVNVGYAFYGTSANPVETAAQYAADWVNFYNKQNNVGIKYWELGNENYGPWQAGFDLGSPQKYADACIVFAQKMKAVDPTIKIGVNLFEGYGGFNQPQGKNWNEIVLPLVQDIADFIIIHHYPHPSTNRNDILEKDIYSAISEVDHTIDWVHDMTTTYTSKPAGYFPIAITEFNARTGVRELSRTNALFTTLMLGEYAKHNDYAAAMQWDLQNGYNVADGSNHGAIATGDPFMVDGSANASLYVYYFLNKYFGNKLVEGQSSHPDIVVYPTTFSSGELGLVVVNTGATNKTLAIDLGTSFTKGNRMYWHTINGDVSDFDRTLYINGQGPGTTFNKGQTYTNGTRSQVATDFETNGVGGPQNYTSILPYSSSIPSSSTIKFNAGAHAVSYIVFEGSTSECVQPNLGDDRVLCDATTIQLTTGLSASEYGFNWKKNNQTVGTSNSLLVNEAGVYTLELTSGACTKTDEVVITSNLPTGINDTVCSSADNVVLKAIGTGNFSWFDKATGGNLLETGATFETNVSSSTTFYLQNTSKTNDSFGKLSIDGATYGNTGVGVYESANRTTLLSVQKAFTLKSLTLFAQTNGANVVLNINGTNYSKSWNFNNLSNTEGFEAVLDANLQPGTYVIDLKGTTGGIKVQYDNSGNQSLSGIASFVTGGGNTDWYGMFFNWKVSIDKSCLRTPVEAIVEFNSGCITGEIMKKSKHKSIELYPNPSSDGRFQLSDIVNWEIYTLQGIRIQKGYSNVLDLSTESKGVYILKTDEGVVSLMYQ